MKKLALVIVALALAVVAVLVNQVEFISANLVEISIANGYSSAYELYRRGDAVYLIAHGGHGKIRDIDGKSHKVSEYAPDFVASKGLPSSDLHVLTCKMSKEAFDYGDVVPVFDRCDISGAIPVPGGFVAFDMGLSRLSAHISYRVQKIARYFGIESKFAVHLRF